MSSSASTRSSTDFARASAGDMPLASASTDEDLGALRLRDRCEEIAVTGESKERLLVTARGGRDARRLADRPRDERGDEAGAHLHGLRVADRDREAARRARSPTRDRGGRSSDRREASVSSSAAVAASLTSGKREPTTTTEGRFAKMSCASAGPPSAPVRRTGVSSRMISEMVWSSVPGRTGQGRLAAGGGRARGRRARRSGYRRGNRRAHARPPRRLPKGRQARETRVLGRVLQLANDANALAGASRSGPAAKRARRRYPSAQPRRERETPGPTPDDRRPCARSEASMDEPNYHARAGIEGEWRRRGNSSHGAGSRSRM